MNWDRQCWCRLRFGAIRFTWTGARRTEVRQPRNKSKGCEPRRLYTRKPVRVRSHFQPCGCSPTERLLLTCHRPIPGRQYLFPRRRRTLGAPASSHLSGEPCFLLQASASDATAPKQRDPIHCASAARRRRITPLNTTRASVHALAILLLSAAGGIDQRDLYAAPTSVPANARVSRFGGWECERGYVRTNDACKAVAVPTNAYLDTGGNRWKCDRGYRKENDRCVAVVVPANGYMDDESRNGWRCNRNYRESADRCVAIAVPRNAYSDESSYGKGWSCERGYRETQDQCIKVVVPANGYLTRNGDDWNCERGFRHEGNTCAAVVVPAGGYLDSSGTDWKCERGRKARGSACVAFDVPAGAHIDHSGNDWTCSNGYRRTSGGCEAEEG